MNKNKLLTLTVILVLIAIAILSFLFSPLKLLFPGKSSFQTASFDEKRIELTLQIKMASALIQESQYISFHIEERLSSEGLVDFKVSLFDDKIEITAKDDKASIGAIEDTLSEFQHELRWEMPVSAEGKVKYILKWEESAWKEYERELRDQIIEVLNRRLENFGFDDFSVDFREYKSSDKPTEIIVLIPSVRDINVIRDTLWTGGYLEFTEVIGDPASTEEVLLSQFGGKLPEKTWIGKEKTSKEERYYLLKSIPIITGRDLKYARLGQDAYGGPAVSFSLTAITADRFGKYTGENIGKRLAIVLDKKIVSAPVIQDRLRGDGMIEGRFTLKEAETLALLLRTGALPAELEIVNERTINP